MKTTMVVLVAMIFLQSPKAWDTPGKRWPVYPNKCLTCHSSPEHYYRQFVMKTDKKNRKKHKDDVVTWWLLFGPGAGSGSGVSWY